MKAEKANGSQQPGKQEDANSKYFYIGCGLVAIAWIVATEQAWKPIWLLLN